MISPQTLSEADRRTVAVWAADCAEHVLGFFESEAPGDSRPRDAIARTRAFARGELDVAEEIRRRFVGHGAAREVNKAMHRPGWQTAPAGRRAPLGLPPFWVAPHRLAYTTIRCCLRHCLIKCHPQSEPFSLGKRLAK